MTPNEKDEVTILKARIHETAVSIELCKTLKRKAKLYARLSRMTKKLKAMV